MLGGAGQSAGVSSVCRQAILAEADHRRHHGRPEEEGQQQPRQQAQPQGVPPGGGDEVRRGLQDSNGIDAGRLHGGDSSLRLPKRRLVAYTYVEQFS